MMSNGECERNLDFENETIEAALNNWIINFNIRSDAVLSLMRILSKELPYLMLMKKEEVTGKPVEVMFDSNNDSMSLFSDCDEDEDNANFNDRDFMEVNDDEMDLEPSKMILESFENYNAIVHHNGNNNNNSKDPKSFSINSTIIKSERAEKFWSRDESYCDTVENTVIPPKSLQSNYEFEGDCESHVVEEIKSEPAIQITIPCQNYQQLNKLNEVCQINEETRTVILELFNEQINDDIETFAGRCLALLFTEAFAAEIDCQICDVTKLYVLQMLKDCVDQEFQSVHIKDFREILMYWFKSFQNTEQKLLLPQMYTKFESDKLENILKELLQDNYQSESNKALLKKQLNIPCVSMSDFYNLETDCQSNELTCKALCQLLICLNDDVINTYIRSSINLILTRRCATKFCWVSVLQKNRPTKVGISNFYLSRIILECALQKFPQCEAVRIKYLMKRFFNTADQFYMSLKKRLNTKLSETAKANINDEMCQKTITPDLNFNEKCNTDSNFPLPAIELPLQTIQDVDRLENELKKRKSSRKVYRKLLFDQHINDLPKYLRKVLKIIITDKLATKYYWNKQCRVLNKTNLNQMYFIKLVKQCSLSLFPDSSSDLINKIMRRWFNLAKQRLVDRKFENCEIMGHVLLLKNIESDIDDDSEQSVNDDDDENVIRRRIQSKLTVEHYNDFSVDLKFPIDCENDLAIFNDQILADSKIELNLYKFFKAKHQKSLFKFISNCMDSIISTTLISQIIYWDNEMDTFETSALLQVIGILKECSYELFQNKYKESTKIEIEIEMQKWLKTAQQRS